MVETLFRSSLVLHSQTLISAQSDYLYLDDLSGDSVDDDGYNSGSGSGDMSKQWLRSSKIFHPYFLMSFT